MNRVLTLVLTLVLLVGCQKDYYLDELREAESVIAGQERLIEELQNQINSITIELDDAEDTIVDITNDLADANITIDELNNNITYLNGVIAERNELINTLTAQASATDEEIADLTAEISDLRDAINELNVRVQDLINNPAVVTETIYVPTVEYVDRWRVRTVTTTLSTDGDVVRVEEENEDGTVDVVEPEPIRFDVNLLRGNLVYYNVYNVDFNIHVTVTLRQEGRPRTITDMLHPMNGIASGSYGHAGLTDAIVVLRRGSASGAVIYTSETLN